MSGCSGIGEECANFTAARTQGGFDGRWFVIGHVARQADAEVSRGRPVSEYKRTGRPEAFACVFPLRFLRTEDSDRHTRLLATAR
jgi:hypothetical protein